MAELALSRNLEKDGDLLNFTYHSPPLVLIKITTRPSYVDVLFTVLVTFEAGEGVSRIGKNRNSGYWKIKNMQNLYQLIIANTSADVSGDTSAAYYSQYV